MSAPASVVTDIARFRREIERYCDGDVPFDVLRVRLWRDLGETPDAIGSFRAALGEMTRSGRLAPQRGIAVGAFLRRLERSLPDAVEPVRLDPLLGLADLRLRPPRPRPKPRIEETPSPEEPEETEAAPESPRGAAGGSSSDVGVSLPILPRADDLPGEEAVAALLPEGVARRAAVEEAAAVEPDEEEDEDDDATVVLEPPLDPAPPADLEEDEDDEATRLLDPHFSSAAGFVDDVDPNEEATQVRHPPARARAERKDTAARSDDSQAAPAKPTAPMPTVGDVVKQRFVLEKRIGKGGMGVVYRALDLRKKEALDRTPYVALKVVGDKVRHYPEAQLAFQREARKAQDLAHPNIVNVYDFDRDGETLFMVMELLEGEPLNRVIKNLDGEGMPQRRALEIVNGLGKALINAHARGVVHADFKPSNCFITHAGDVKVLDFGIARAFKASARSDPEESTVFDPASFGALTPAFASCEMLEGTDPDPRDDIYPLAVVAYLLLAGRHPFDRKSAVEARDGEMTPARIRGLSASQWNGLARGLALERKKRTPTVRRFLRDINPPRRRRMAFLAGGIALALALAIAFLPVGRLVDRQLAWLDVKAVREGDVARLDTLVGRLEGMHPDLRRYYSEEIGPTMRQRLIFRFRQRLQELERGAADRQSLETALPEIDAAEADLARLESLKANDPAVVRARHDLATTLVGTLAQSLRQEWPLPMARLEESLVRLEPLWPGRYPFFENTLVNALMERIADAGHKDLERAEALHAAGQRLFPNSGPFRGDGERRDDADN